jgi:hypothetical protein
VRIDCAVAILQDSNGDNFRATISYLEYAPVFSEGDYWIDLHVNCEKKKANAFLCRSISYEQRKKGEYHCIGGVDLDHSQKSTPWRVRLDVPYDPETDSDSMIIGFYNTQQEAIKVLWEERFNV